MPLLDTDPNALQRQVDLMRDATPGDIRALAGQPVFATWTGTVVYAGADMLDYGNAVILDHGNGLTTLYGHNQELLVRAGERVTRGQTIARAGRSGNASTVHVHFEVRRYAEALDPLRFLGSAGR
jgi:murein DD-endopeptidase MepM/ murein hydrolase activator NlpD